MPPPAVTTIYPQILRLSSDRSSGKVKLDDAAPVELQEGQFTSDALGWGKHTLEITSGNATATIHFEAAPSRAPVLTENPTAKELKAIAVTSFGNQVRIQSN